MRTREEEEEKEEEAEGAWRDREQAREGKPNRAACRSAA